MSPQYHSIYKKLENTLNEVVKFHCSTYLPNTEVLIDDPNVLKSLKSLVHLFMRKIPFSPNKSDKSVMSPFLLFLEAYQILRKIKNVISFSSDANMTTLKPRIKN